MWPQTHKFKYKSQPIRSLHNIEMKIATNLEMLLPPKYKYRSQKIRSLYIYKYDHDCEGDDNTFGYDDLKISANGI